MALPSLGCFECSCRDDAGHLVRAAWPRLSSLDTGPVRPRMTILTGLEYPLRRRTLLGAVGWAAVAGPAQAMVRPPAQAPGVRRLKLFNAHTNETFEGPYRGANGPLVTAAAELAEFLRDHH